MDIVTLMAAISAAKGLPDSAASRAIAAAEEAEAAAEVAVEHSVGISIIDHGIVIEEGTSE